MKVSQSQFVEQSAARMGITASQAEDFVRNFKNHIYQQLAAGNSVELSGFGQFSVSHRDARLGYNPKTKLPMTIPELNTPKFKTGAAFKQAIAIKH